MYRNAYCIGDPDCLVTASLDGESKPLSNWRSFPHLQLLNILYDVTPAQYITMIITEVGMIPPSSVPVVMEKVRKDLIY